MAQLPPDGTWLIQQNDGIVSIFHRYTQEVLISFNPKDKNETSKAMETISKLEQLDDEQKCFAYFWSGYFYAH